jgi:hypothetical protein
MKPSNSNTHGREHTGQKAHQHDDFNQGAEISVGHDDRVSRACFNQHTNPDQCPNIQGRKEKKPPELATSRAALHFAEPFCHATLEIAEKTQWHFRRFMEIFDHLRAGMIANLYRKAWRSDRSLLWCLANGLKMGKAAVFKRLPIHHAIRPDQSAATDHTSLHKMEQLVGIDRPSLLIANNIIPALQGFPLNCHQANQRVSWLSNAVNIERALHTTHLQFLAHRTKPSVARRATPV